MSDIVSYLTIAILLSFIVVFLLSGGGAKWK